MANAKDITSNDGNVLIIGDGGTWKTRFLGSVPGIYVFDFDKGMASLRGQDVEYDTFKDAGRTVKSRTADGKAASYDFVEPGPKLQAAGIYRYGSAWDAFYKKFLDIAAKIEAGKGPRAIGFDSLTMMSMCAANKILKDTGHEFPHQGTWGAHHDYFKMIFGMATAWPIRFICTAHVQRDENDISKNVEKLPLLVGKLAGLVPVFFDEVWYTEMVGGKAIIHTMQDASLKQAKSRWNVPDKTPLTWEAMQKYIELPKGA
jgi:hypothetical protein